MTATSPALASGTTRGWIATAAGAAAVVAALAVLYSAYIPLMNDFEVYYYGGSRVLQTGETGRQRAVRTA